MEKIKIIILSLCILFCCACDSNKDKEIKQFSLNFAEKISKNQVDSVRALYPDAVNCDSFALVFNADSIQVVETQTPGTFKVKMGKADFTVKKVEGGNMTVTESHGLFAYLPSDLEFAKKTGQWKDGITDKELAKRMNDKDFEKSLVENFEKEFSKRLSITHKVPNSNFEASERQSIYIVKNNSSTQIDGSDYEISIPFFKEDYMFDPNPKRWNEIRKGKTISPNGSVTYEEYIVTERGDFSRSGPVFNGHTIVLKLKGKALLNKYFSATGNEYEEYLKAKH